MAYPILTREEVISGCGAGQGARCCKFILLGYEGSDDFVCGRETELKQTIIERQGMNAQRVPTEPYPLCQLKSN